jgi:hypothetical protein
MLSNQVKKKHEDFLSLPTQGYMFDLDVIERKKTRKTKYTQETSESTHAARRKNSPNIETRNTRAYPINFMLVNLQLDRGGTTHVHKRPK